MLVTGGDRYSIVKLTRNCRLTVVVAAPSHYRPVFAQSEGMKAAGRYRHYIRQSGRNGDLAVAVQTPCHDGSIGTQSQAVIVTASNDDDIRQTRWHSTMILIII